MFRWISKHTRILPITAAIAVMVLGVRVGELSQLMTFSEPPEERVVAYGAAIAAEPAAGPEPAPMTNAFDEALPAYSPAELAIL